MSVEDHNADPERHSQDLGPGYLPPGYGPTAKRSVVPHRPTVRLREFLLARIAEDEAEQRAETGWGMCEAPEAYHWPPERVLAECEAKRRIVSRMVAGPVGSDPWDEGWHVAAEEFAEMLALPYADHPDYRDEWRP